MPPKFMLFLIIRKQCLENRYNSSVELIERETIAWEGRRNALKKAKVEWMFAIEDARKKMGHLYPKLLKTVTNWKRSKVFE